MAITLFGTASTPADNGTNTTNPTVVTPPSSMLAGDLVWLVACGANTSGTNSISQTGGQTWNALTQINQTRNRVTCFWCRFNGTWTANPSVTMTGTANNIVRMLVFRPNGGTSADWVVDTAVTAGTYAAPTGPPYEVTRTGLTVSAGALVLVTLTSRDDNIWEVSGGTGTGWVEFTPLQVRNTSGLYDQSVTGAYKVETLGGATGTVIFEQLSLGPDAGTRHILSFRETAIHSAVGRVEAASEAKNENYQRITPAYTADINQASSVSAAAGRIFSLSGAVASVSSAVGKVTKPDRLKGIYTWVVKAPVVGGIAGVKLPANTEIEEISSYVTSGTSATFNVESRAACESAGDNLLASDQVADADGTSIKSFSVTSAAKGRWLWLDISAVSGTPGQLSVTVKFAQYIETLRELAGQVIAAAAVAAKATVLHAARAVVSAASSAVGLIRGTLLSAGTGHVAAASSAVARLSGTILLAGSVAAASTVAGVGGRAFSVAGSSSATSSVVAKAAQEGLVYQTHTWVVKTPAVGGIPGPKVPKTGRVIEISSFVTAATSATFNIERRAECDEAGTNLLSADQTADTDGTSATSFALEYASEDYWLWLDISAVSGTPGQLSVTVAYAYTTESISQDAQGASAGTSSVTGAAGRIYSLKGSSAAVSSVVATATPQTNIRKDFHTFVLSNVAAGVVAGPKLPEQIEITEVSGYIVGGTGVTFNLQLRTTPNVAVGTFMSSSLTVGTAGAATTGFTSGVGDKDKHLFLNITHVDGTPTQLSVTVHYLPNPAVRGRVEATSSVIGKITCEKKVAGAIHSWFGTTGDFVRARFVAASVMVSSGSGATGAVTIMVAAAGQVEATSSVVGQVGFQTNPQGLVSTTSSVTGAASVLKPVAGQVSATSVVSGEISKIGGPTGRVSATSRVIGYADIRDKARGWSDAVSSVIGNATIMYEHRAAGVSAGSSEAAAKLTYTMGLFSGRVTAQSSAVARAVVFKPVHIWAKVNGEWRLSSTAGW